MLVEDSEPARDGHAPGDRPRELPRRIPGAQTHIARTELVILIQEIERMQARFAHRNNTGWVHACDTLLGNCRKLLGDGGS